MPQKSLLLSDEEYVRIKGGLNEQGRKEIEELEKDRDNPSVDYWEIYRKAYGSIVGRYFEGDELRARYEAPVHKLRMHILCQAARMRGIKFSE